MATLIRLHLICQNEICFDDIKTGKREEITVNIDAIGFIGGLRSMKGNFPDTVELHYFVIHLVSGKVLYIDSKDFGFLNDIMQQCSR